MKILCVHLLRVRVLWLDVSDAFLVSSAPAPPCPTAPPQRFTFTPGSAVGRCGRVETASGGWDSQRSSGLMAWDVLAGSSAELDPAETSLERKHCCSSYSGSSRRVAGLLLRCLLTSGDFHTLPAPLNFAWQVRCSWKCALNVMLRGH